VAAPIAGLILALPALAAAVLPDLIAYAAIHLRYDTTWYVLTPRSIRIRRGIWAITETTITFENIQNITVQQGPLQRYYGIASLHIRTAGGGGGHGQHSGSDTSHLGVIEGDTTMQAMPCAMSLRYSQNPHGPASYTNTNSRCTERSLRTSRSTTSASPPMRP